MIRSKVTGTEINYREELIKLALKGTGELDCPRHGGIWGEDETCMECTDIFGKPLSFHEAPWMDREVIAAALFNLVVTTIREYEDALPVTRQLTWSELSYDIAEQFDHDWINPTSDQEAYLHAEHVIRNFENRHGKPRVS